MSNKEYTKQELEFLETPDEILERYGDRWDIEYYAGHSRLVYYGDKPGDIYEAFDISFEKWELLRDLAVIGCLFIGDGGPYTCGLCMMFFYNDDYACKGCPIDDITHDGCTGTPYSEWHNNYLCNLDAAERELEFLREVKKGYIEETGNELD